MDQAVVEQEALSLEQVMARRFELVEMVAIIQGKHKAELEPHQEELHMCELFIKDEMNKAGLQQVKTVAGMAFFQTKDSVSVEDFDAILAHIREKELWHLLTKAISKTATKEYIEEHKTPPPGVRYDSYRDLAWRKGKG